MRLAASSMQRFQFSKSLRVFLSSLRHTKVVLHSMTGEFFFYSLILKQSGPVLNLMPILSASLSTQIFQLGAIITHCLFSALRYLLSASLVVQVARCTFIVNEAVSGDA